MNYHSKTPARPLGVFVERLWQFSDAPTHDREWIVPSGTVELVINLHEDALRIYDPERPECCRRFSGAVISGTYSNAFVIDPRQHASIIGVHFRPGCAFPFLGIPGGEVGGSHVDLQAVWGSRATELRERLGAAGSPIRRFELLENALASHLCRARNNHPAVSFALHAFAEAGFQGGIRDTARATGFSQRRFIQLFKDEVGLAPKLFCRIRRFQRALALVRQTDAPEWAQIALDCGYCDQSHFIRDFRDFSGLSPADYTRRQSDKVLENHVPMAEQVNFVQYRRRRA